MFRVKMDCDETQTLNHHLSKEAAAKLPQSSDHSTVPFGGPTCV